jgi:hypothetical protein
MRSRLSNMWRAGGDFSGGSAAEASANHGSCVTGDVAEESPARSFRALAMRSSRVASRSRSPEGVETWAKATVE